MTRATRFWAAAGWASAAAVNRPNRHAAMTERQKPAGWQERCSMTIPSLRSGAHQAPRFRPFQDSGDRSRRAYLAAAAPDLKARWRGAGWAAFGHGAGREAAEGADAVVHDDGAGHGQVDAEAGWYAHHVVAAGEQLRRQGAALPAQHIGRAAWMVKARQVDGFIEQLHTHQAAALWQYQRGRALPVIVRQVLHA